MTLDYKKMDEIAKRVSFMYDHHHLISPFMFTEREIQRRNFLLLVSHWNDASF